MAFTVLFTLTSCKEKPDEAAVDKLKEAIKDVENGTAPEINFDPPSEEETYGYRLLTREGSTLPADLDGLREGIDLIIWWCDPGAAFPDGTVQAFEYVGKMLINETTECYYMAYGAIDEDGELDWKHSYAVDFAATTVFELNVATMEYVELYRKG
jgi:hypothetical protein